MILSEKSANPGSSPGRAFSGSCSCRLYLNLDLLLRPLQQRLDAGAHRRLSRHRPGVPHLVELVDRADVRQPDRGGQKLGLVGPGLGEEAVDEREDLGRLLGEALADRLVGGEAREIDGVAMDDDLAHPRSGIDALYGHGWFLSLPRRL